MDARKAVFLDRDGTIVEERGNVTSPDGITLLPGAARAVIALRRSGWKVFVATNQSAVAHGLMTEEELGAVNFRMVALLGAEGAGVDGIYYCPHHPRGKVPSYTMECDCRKPGPGLLERAAAEHGLDLARCVMVGDSIRDLQAGRAAGTKTILVRTGNGAKTEAGPHGADHAADDLEAAAAWLDAPDA